MHRRQYQLMYLALPAMLGVAACGDPLAPRDVAGIYTLQNTPRVILGSAFSVRILADTFVLRADGTGVRRTHYEVTDTASTTPVREARSAGFTFRVEERAVGFLWLCPPATVCVGVRQRDWYDLSGETRAMWSREDDRRYAWSGARAP